MEIPPERFDIDAAGQRLTCLGLGARGPLALLLHGFPDTPMSLLPLGASLAAAGFRVVLPWLRGYAPSAAPRHQRTDLEALSGDALSIVAHLGAGPALIVGHDWGAAIAYTAAARAPKAVAGVVGMSVPPLAHFVRKGARSPAQLWRSRYMAQFQVPGAARVLEPQVALRVERFWRDWGPFGPAHEALVGHAVASLSQPGALDAALSYYRALIPTVGAHLNHWKEAARWALAPVPVPGLVLHGESDGCIAPHVFSGAEGQFTAPARRVCLQGAGHFLHVDQPLLTEAAVLGFARSLSARR
jgi:pimeloyl-ACP methyl ester carboxylesterase